MQKSCLWTTASVFIRGYFGHERRDQSSHYVISYQTCGNVTDICRNLQCNPNYRKNSRQTWSQTVSVKLFYTFAGFFGILDLDVHLQGQNLLNIWTAEKPPLEVRISLIRILPSRKNPHFSEVIHIDDGRQHWHIGRLPGNPDDIDTCPPPSLSTQTVMSFKIWRFVRINKSHTLWLRLLWSEDMLIFIIVLLEYLLFHELFSQAGLLVNKEVLLVRKCSAIRGRTRPQQAGLWGARLYEEWSVFSDLFIKFALPAALSVFLTDV